MTKRTRVKKGGSRASNAVMSLNPKVCMDYTTPVIEGPKINYKLEDLSLYRTTGGGKKRHSNRKSRKSYKGNKHSKGNRHRQGNRHSKGNRHRQGNRHSKGRKNTNKIHRKIGGSRASNAVTKLGGKVCNATNRLKGGNSPIHPGLKDCHYKNLVSTQNSINSSSNSPSVSDTMDVVVISKDHDNINCQKVKVGGGSSDWKSTLYSRGPVNNPDMSKTQFRAFTQTGDYVPMSSLRSGKFLKGGYRKNSKKGKKSKSKRGGGSSDWRSTLYSRGSYIAPNMERNQFRAFTKNAEYIPNESMRTSVFMK